MATEILRIVADSGEERRYACGTVESAKAFNRWITNTCKVSAARQHKPGYARLLKKLVIRRRENVVTFTPVADSVVKDRENCLAQFRQDNVDDFSPEDAKIALSSGQLSVEDDVLGVLNGNPKRVFTIQELATQTSHSERVLRGAMQTLMALDEIRAYGNGGFGTVFKRKGSENAHH